MPPLAICRLQTHAHTHAHTGSSTCCWSRSRTTATAPCRRSHPSSDLAGVCWLKSEARTRTPSLVFNIARLHGAGVALTPRLRLSAVKGIDDGSCCAKKRPRASSAVLDAFCEPMSLQSSRLDSLRHEASRVRRRSPVSEHGVSSQASVSCICTEPAASVLRYTAEQGACRAGAYTLYTSVRRQRI